MIKAAGIVLLAGLLCQEKTNPQFEYWSSCKIGSWVRNQMQMENRGQKFEIDSTTTLVEVMPDKVLIETVTKGSPPRKTEIKAVEAQKGKTIVEKEEELTVAGKTLQCRYFEMESEGTDKKKVIVKAWMSKEIPGGIAKSEVTSESLGSPIRTIVLGWEKK
jgi:hypothetical protein